MEYFFHCFEKNLFANIAVNTQGSLYKFDYATGKLRSVLNVRLGLDESKLNDLRLF